MTTTENFPRVKLQLRQRGLSYKSPNTVVNLDRHLVTRDYTLLSMEAGVQK